MNTHDTIPAPAAVRRRAWPVLLLALPAFVAIWSGWVELGRLTGFGPVSPLPGIWDDARIDTAITLPIGVETYAAYAMYVWLALAVSDRARRFACVSAIGSLCLGAGGQVAYHLMAAAGVQRAPWPITALVACLPVAVLGMGAALAHLVAEAPDTRDTGDQEARADQDQDDAEARTERAVIVNALRDQHIDDRAPAPERTSEGTAPMPQAPTQRTRPARTTRSNADKARALRDKHPDWPVARIAERVGVTERTARRYFTAPPAPDTDQTDDQSPAEVPTVADPVAA